MSIIATGQISIIDLSDGKSLSAYITANLPKTQIFDPNPGGAITPDWSGTPKLLLTPVVFANQTPLPLGSPGLSVNWKRKEGAGAEATLISGETVSGSILTVSKNTLSDVPSKLLTYCAYVTYTDPATGVPVNIVADITFSQIQTAMDAKSCWVSGEQIFKYDTGGSVSPAQIVLTANLQNVTVEKWQYKNESDAWVDYPTTADNAIITGTTLIVKPTHGVFVDDCAAIRVLTSEAGISDMMSIFKVRDGMDGNVGTSAPVTFLTNENMTFAGNASGQVSAITKECNVVAYLGTEKVTPTVGEITGMPTGMTVSKGAAVGNEIPLTISIAANATLGGASPQQGTLAVPITSPVNTTLHIQWSKVNTGAKGAAGQSAVVFSLYAPEGSVFLNGEGELPIRAAAYNGTTEITSGASYVWKRFVSGNWNALAGESDSTLTVNGADVAGVASFQCVMTYGGKEYKDTISLIDKTDNYQAAIDSSGGDVFKNGQGESTLTCRLFQNGQEVDADGSKHTYKWYRLDKDGNALDVSAPFRTGKAIFIDGDDVDIKTTFKVEVE